MTLEMEILASMDGQSFGNVCSRPANHFLMRWADLGYYGHDLVNKVYRLTQAGRRAVGRGR